MSITTSVESTKLYRANRRRFFTLKAAANAEAKRLINLRCDCDEPDMEYGYPGNTCEIHGREDFQEYKDKLADRLRRRFVRLQRRT